MKIKSLFFSFLILIIGGQNLNAQIKYSTFFVDKQMKDTFSFKNKWDYSWEVFKDARTRKFTKNSSARLVPSDTAHLFYTANSFTNIQGGYDIRYCFADQSKEIITLTFSDGLPAFASEFYVYLQGDSFYFKPKTVYPMYIRGQKFSYQVTKQHLTLNKTNYKIGELIMGYVDVEFIETVSVPNKETKAYTFYLKGYVRTTIKRPPQYGE